MSTSMPIVNMWWAHTIKPRAPIPNIAYTIPNVPKGSGLAEAWVTTWDITPKAGRIRM